MLKDNTENLKRDIKESKSTETGQLYGLVMKKVNRASSDIIQNNTNTELVIRKRIFSQMLLFKKMRANL